LVGAIFGILAAIITMVFNVPLNNHLDTVNPEGLSALDAAREWQAYLSTWSGWNHVRTVTSFIGAVLMVGGLRYR
jgi:uncharacterized membrane protein